MISRRALNVEVHGLQWYVTGCVRCRRQMRIATLLSWPMSLGWRDIWIESRNIAQKRSMYGRTVMTPLYSHGGWFMGSSCMTCGVSTMLCSLMRPLVHILPLQETCYMQKVAREEGPGWLQFTAQTVKGAWNGVLLVRFVAHGPKCASSPPV